MSPKITYTPRQFSASSLAVIDRANAICAEFAAQGFNLTLRQLYYQFVSRGLLANKDAEYKRLGSIINDARLAGQLDWGYIVDRTRNLQALDHWADPAAIMRDVPRWFAVDRWAEQPCRLECWIEKDALVGVIADVCDRNAVPYFSCRGYTSQSEVWGAAQRLRRYLADGQDVVLLHLGDHDPSGLDMTRDIRERLQLFLAHHGFDDCLQVERLALNWDQIQEYDPPPNPTKLTDARAGAYLAEYGESSWELDALEPAVIAALIQEAVDRHRDAEVWEVALAREGAERAVLEIAAERWDEVAAFLDGEAQGGR